MKRNLAQTREGAVANLRAAFARLYDELRARGHVVIVEYEDPGNPLYIPQILEVDELKPRLNLSIERAADDRRIYGYTYVIAYEPSWVAKEQYMSRARSRSDWRTPAKMTGPELATWVEMLIDVEKRSARWRKDRVPRR